MNSVFFKIRTFQTWLARQTLPFFTDLSKLMLMELMVHSNTDPEIFHCGQGRIDSVKINPSLLMMRECFGQRTKVGWSINCDGMRISTQLTDSEAVKVIREAQHP